MPELKVSISETTHKTLLTMVKDSGETIQSVLDRAIENYRRSALLILGMIRERCDAYGLFRDR